MRLIAEVASDARSWFSWDGPNTAVSLDHVITLIPNSEDIHHLTGLGSKIKTPDADSPWICGPFHAYYIPLLLN